MWAIKTILKLAVVVLLVSVVAVVIGINYATYASTYECSGEITNPGATVSQQTPLLIKWEHYRWWVLWIDWDGRIHFEIPNTIFKGFFSTLRVGEYVFMYRSDINEPQQGEFSTVSNSLRL